MPPRRAAAAAALASKRVAVPESDSDSEDADAGQSSEESSGSHSAYSHSESDQDDDDEQEEQDGRASTAETDDPPPASKRKRGPAGAARKSVGGRNTSSQHATPLKRNKSGTARGGGRRGAAVRKGRQDLEDEDDQGLDTEDEESDNILLVTKLTPAPSQRHEAGKLGTPVIDFLAKLADPEYNDREWFRANERVWKWVKDDWDLFVSNFLESLMDDVDETVPFLPPKDMVYRIHRDVRFSNDKTPYKRALMATFARGGRKGPYAGYHLVLRANDQSGFYAGLWDPEASMVTLIRNHIKNDTDEFRRFKEVINAPAFVATFGPSKPNPKKGIQGSLWGTRDQLKTAPKGVDKTHAEIDFLRLKSVCISAHFTDLEVSNRDPKRSGDFKVKCIEAAKVAKDFVEVLNEMMYPAED